MGNELLQLKLLFKLEIVKVTTSTKYWVLLSRTKKKKKKNLKKKIDFTY